MPREALVWRNEKAFSLAAGVVESIRVRGTRYKEAIQAAAVGVPDDLIVTRDVWTDPVLNVVVAIEGKKKSGLLAPKPRNSISNRPLKKRWRGPKARASKFTRCSPALHARAARFGIMLPLPRSLSR